jgi:hypothetical protein
MESSEPIHKVPELPNKMRMYTPGQPENVPNTVGVVEDFFQTKLSHEVIDEVAHLPPEQLDELLSRGRKVSDEACTAVSMRGLREARSHVEDLSRYEYYQALFAGDIVYNEALMQAGLHSSVASTRGLRQLALYADRAVMRDSVFAKIPNEEADPRRVLVGRLREILPMADLIRSGQMVPISTEKTFTTVEDNVWFATMVRSDPFINWVVANNPKLAIGIRAIYDALDDPGSREHPSYPGNSDIRLSLPPDYKTGMAELARLVQSVYPEAVSAQELRRIMLECAKLRAGLYSPVSGDKRLIYHLKLCAYLRAENPKMLTGLPVAHFSPAVRFELPAAQVPVELLGKLRQNEPVFGLLRQALRDHSLACAEDAAAAEGFSNYQQIVRRNAETVIRPAYEELMAWHKRAQRKKWGALILGGTFGFGLDHLNIIGGKFVGQAFGILGSQRAHAELEDITAATQILKSLL